MLNGTSTIIKFYNELIFIINLVTPMNNMEHTNELLGFTSILIIIFLTYIAILRWPSISKILLVALVVRVLLVLGGHHHYLFELPDYEGDSEDFETSAWILAQGGISYVWNYLDLPDPHAYIWFIGLIYALIDRSIMMIQAISILFGLGSVVLGWKISKIIWNTRTADKVGWMIALFPSLVLYSVLVMREVYMVFFLLLALYGVVAWAKTNSLKSIIIALIGFFGGAFFHGAIFVGAITFLTIVGLSSFIKFYKSVLKNRLNLKTVFMILLISIVSQFYLTNKFEVSYLGSFEESSRIDNLLDLTEINTRGTASWPKWTIISSPVEMIYKIPVRSIYFIFGPFPWDIKKPSHLIIMLDAFLYIYLSYLILKNIKVIWRDPALRIILIILVSYVLVFSIGVGNFGTGVRHRSKFVIMFILLAAPLLKRFIFFTKKDKIKNSKEINNKTLNY